jgi:D-proline reductase (dithiol) PrdB
VSDVPDYDDSDVPREVDPWRFCGTMLRKFISDQIPDQPGYANIPWTPPTKPLTESKVALLSTAGISMKGDPPFDMDRERREPLWGDPSWRRISSDASSATVEVNHLHIKTDYVLEDLNVALPLDRLRELVEDGVVGAVADNHYSTMGYQGADTSVLENQSAPEIARSLLEEGVDLLMLAPV